MVVTKYTIPLLSNIAPLYKLTTLTGVIVPFEYPPGSCGLTVCLRYVVIFLVGFGMCFETGFGVYSMASYISEGGSVQKFVLMLVKYLLNPIGIVTLTTFTWHRISIHTFLQKWTHLETSLDLPNFKTSTPFNRYRLLSIVANGQIIMSTVSAALSGIVYTNEFPTFAIRLDSQGSLTFSIVYALEVVVYFYIASISSFGEHMATYVYRHLAFVLSKVEQSFLAEIRLLSQENYNLLPSNHVSSIMNSFISTTPSVRCERKQRSVTKSVSYQDAMKNLLERIEYQNLLVKKAQNLFGPVLFASYAVSFFTTCCSSYFVFLSFRLQRSDSFFGGYTMLFITSIGQTALIIKLIFLTYMCNSLPKQFGEFQNTLSTVLLQHWDKLTTEDRCLYRTFLHHISLKKWEAAPLNLFTITTRTLLSMIGLIATYVIVLLQTQCA